MEYLYPGGLPKAMTFSYDDGQVYDRRLVKLFDEAGFKATFHPIPVIWASAGLSRRRRPAHCTKTTRSPVTV